MWNAAVPRLRILLHIAASGAAATLVGGIVSLDPDGYHEPDDIAYYARPVARQGALDGNYTLPSTPFEASRIAGLTREEFDGLIRNGLIFVVPNVSDSWPMKDWDCNFFNKDKEFRNVEITHQYTQGGGDSSAVLSSNWEHSKTPSGAKDDDAPATAPYYWGIKDIQYDDAHTSPTWKQSMLKRVQKSVRVPDFMAPENLRNFHSTPEFWLSPSGAGAKAHMDSHVQATMSIQLGGTKRWRMAPLGQRRAPHLGMIYQDGYVYDKFESKWEPFFNITLRKGEALFFPPGVIHETQANECSTSVTFQFSSPWSARWYRRFFPRVRRTPDIHESWPLIRSWATLGSRSQKLKSGMPYQQAKAKAPELFKKLDGDRDDILKFAEIRSSLGEDVAGGALAWHDLNEDGQVSADEFAEGFAFWAATTHQVIQATPKEWRKYQVKDMEELNIEDLPEKLQKAMRTRMFAMEREARTEL